MQEVPSIAIDTRQGRNRILVGVRSEHWGPTVSHSDDLGSTWIEPEHGAIHFPDGSGAAIERVWQIQPDTADRTGVVWAGCEPISVWKSTDGGAHFELNRGLWNNRHRNSWGAGYGGAAAHSIAVDPSDAAIVHVAMSTGGVYRTTDGGDSWIARNNGISAHFLPDPNPEFGQCVHKITRDAVEPKRLYAQNHHGVYRSDDNGDNWISIAEGLPSDFGFAILSHPRQSGTVWVIPLTADAMRFPPEGKLAVHRTSDAGASWTRFDTGLPQSTYNSVLRDAATLDTADPAGLYLGTRDGMVYASSDEGESFSELASHLPDVLCVRAAVLNG
jgi:photosystem II stability/assembly factor-like uncharacterized protein